MNSIVDMIDDEEKEEKLREEKKKEERRKREASHEQSMETIKKNLNEVYEILGLSQKAPPDPLQYP
jgi:hypothetical protein